MITPDLLKYIQNEVSKNIDVTIIRQTLLLNKWNEADIDAAFLSLHTNSGNDKLKPSLSIKHKIPIWKVIIIIFFTFIVLFISFLFITGKLYLNKMQKTANQMQPYLPEGYTIIKKAERSTEFNEFLTILQNDDKSIIISVKPTFTWTCPTNKETNTLKTINNNSVCEMKMSTGYWLTWNKDDITYLVTSTKEPLEELEKIVSSL